MRLVDTELYTLEPDSSLVFVIASAAIGANTVSLKCDSSVATFTHLNWTVRWPVYLPYWNLVNIQIS